MTILDPGTRPGHNGAQPSPRAGSPCHRAPASSTNQTIAWHDEVTGCLRAREQTALPRDDPGYVSKRMLGTL
jgi:hypothetical protein